MCGDEKLALEVVRLLDLLVLGLLVGRSAIAVRVPYLCALHLILLVCRFILIDLAGIAPRRRARPRQRPPPHHRRHPLQGQWVSGWDAYRPRILKDL